MLIPQGLDLVLSVRDIDDGDMRVVGEEREGVEQALLVVAGEAVGGLVQEEEAGALGEQGPEVWRLEQRARQAV